VDANLSSRLTTAVFAIPLLVFLVGWSPPWVFAAVFFILMIGALHEYFAMAFPRDHRNQWGGVVFGVCVSGAIFLNGDFDALAWLSTVVLLGFSLFLFLPGELIERLHRLLFTLLGGLYVGFLFPHWVMLFRYRNGRAWVFWVLWIIMIGDTVAYFVGQRFGTRKLASELSPAKTVEGAWGYLIGAVIAGFVGAIIFLHEISGVEVFFLSLSLGILGQVGDLFESWLKRVFVVKDSGNLLPGHGGLLDRLDSLIFPAVFTTTYLKVFHP
jgi:phosphatidate cytidylyltransferase